jgi:predicted aspartyl protease
VDDIALLRCAPGFIKASVLPGVFVVLLGLGTAVAAPETAAVPPAGLSGDTVQPGGPLPPANIEDSLFASPTTHDHIGRVVVPVKINGRGPYRFIVDTGANHSTISPDLVRELALKTGTQSLITLDGITGAAQVTYVSIDRLQAGDLTIEETTLPVVWGPVMGGADGILGAAGMSEKSLLIDFQRNRVAIASHMEAAARTRAIKIHASRVASGLMVLDTLIAGVHVQAVLDTGSERTLGNMALREALRSQQLGKKGFVAQLTSVYGATKEVEPGEVLLAPTISIDALRITDVHIVYGDFHIFKIWNMQDKPAMILGMDVLGTVASLNIDFKNQTVYLGSVPAANKDFLSTPHDMSNIQSMRK